jgi:hypothetical protein
MTIQRLKLYVMGLILGICLTSVWSLTVNAMPVQEQSWVNTGPGSVSVTESTYGVQFEYYLQSNLVHDGQTWVFSAVASADTELFYIWDYAGNHAWYNTVSKLEVFIERNGVGIRNEILMDLTPFGAFTASGDLSLQLDAGDTYGFRVTGRNYDSNNFLFGTLSIYSSPRVEPVIDGILGNNDWYRSDVELSWSLTDPAEHSIDSSGCEPVTVTNDTNADGHIYTCTASSLGGETTRSITIKRDATAPITTAAPTVQNDTRYVSVHFDSVDNSSGNVTTYYSVDDGEDQTGSSVLLREQGFHWVSYWSVDEAGNAELASTIYVEVQLLPIGEDGEFDISDMIQWIRQGTLQQTDMNDDGVFDRIDIAIMLHYISPSRAAMPAGI